MDINAPSAQTTDFAEQTERLARLTNRAMLATAQMQGHAVKQASGSEYALMDAGTLAKAYGTFWNDMMADPNKLMDIQQTVGTEMMGGVAIPVRPVIGRTGHGPLIQGTKLVGRSDFTQLPRRVSGV